MAKIVLVSMIMVVSIHSVMGDATTSPSMESDAAEAYPPSPDEQDNSKESWIDWAKDKISGIGGMFSSYSPSSSLASGPALAPVSSPAAAPEFKV
ncbi:hypothetical protein J1N35_026349 [Gossypium stocksii]|uniref:Uncharacterized protein n=1 Tax=Gossypium stocksii TaxID=47602 RepID=A0A9D3V954_9ROSI|nr:hypothetical protein J1N35_026349 [Gossypium stocksii]